MFIYAFIIILKQIFNNSDYPIFQVNTTLLTKILKGVKIMKIKAEYIWIDGKTPTAKLRSKTKIMDMGTEPPIWGFDGSSTEQATGDQSDCVLKPVAQYPDPIRGGDNILVMCEVLNVDMTPHASNTRAACAASATP